MHKHWVLGTPSFLLKVPQAIFPYLATKIVVDHSSTPKTLVNSDVLSFAAYGVCNKKQAEFNAGLEYMESIGMVTRIDDHNYYATELPCKAPFVLIYEEEFYKIVQSGKSNHIALLQHFCRIVKSLDYNIELSGRTNVVGHMAISYFTNEYGTSYNSIINYNVALEQLGLIYIAKGNAMQTNLYGRKEDEQIIKEYSRRFNTTDRSNFYRSVSARYNRYINNPGVFSAEEVEQLYNDCVRYNEETANDPTKSEKALDKIKRNVYSGTTKN